MLCFSLDPGKEISVLNMKIRTYFSYNSTSHYVPLFLRKHYQSLNTLCISWLAFESAVTTSKKARSSNATFLWSHDPTLHFFFNCLKPCEMHQGPTSCFGRLPLNLVSLKDHVCHCVYLFSNLTLNSWEQEVFWGTREMIQSISVLIFLSEDPGWISSTHKYITICSSSCRSSIPLFWPHHIHICRQNTYIK